MRWCARLTPQPPFHPRIGHPEAPALGIALRIAARVRHHHGQVTTVVEGVTHSRCEQRRLQPAPPHLWDGSGAAKQSNPFMVKKHARGARLAIQLGEKAGTLRAGGGNAAHLIYKILKFRMFVGPAPGADLAPELRFFRTDNARANANVAVFGHGFFYRPIHDVTDLDRSVLAGTQQCQRSGSHERTHLVKHFRPAVEKKALDRIERRRTQLLKEAEPKGLRDGRADGIEYRIGSRAFYPLCAAVRD